ncbi:MAG: hypothetical protein QF805_17200, partial [Pirellulaceae bacterium]|nr:hypothetical protein [Pirellulaceae bacterium]
LLRPLFDSEHHAAGLGPLDLVQREHAFDVFVRIDDSSAGEAFDIRRGKSALEVDLLFALPSIGVLLAELRFTKNSLLVTTSVSVRAQLRVDGAE